VPNDLNADSILEVTSLTSTDLAAYETGDCFIIEFNPIEAY
jgi:hypothetical protein